MHLSIAIVVSYSFVALLLAGGYGEEGNSEQESCKKLEKRLEIDDPGFDESILRFVYNETLERCIYDLVKCNETNSYENLHDCVTKCKTDQGAPKCANIPQLSCNATDECDEFFYYDMNKTECLKMNISLSAPPTQNVFFTKGLCTSHCKKSQRMDGG
uniref:Putative secreted protein n=1 Tax=Amblyomma triste TaxID=251400 RepID=A0A023GD36_AMBTT